MNLPVGTITLLIIAVLVYFGVAQRLLDRMRLTDRTALLFIGGMLVGTFIPDIPLGSRLAINVGGGLIRRSLPCIYGLQPTNHRNAGAPCGYYCSFCFGIRSFHLAAHRTCLCHHRPFTPLL